MGLPIAARLVLLFVPFAAACSSSSSSSTSDAPLFSTTVRVPAGSESFQCQYVKMSAAREYATTISHTYTTGSHHLVVFRTDQSQIPAGQDAMTPCYESGSDFMSHVRGMLYTSQTPVDSNVMPSGVGFAFEPNEVLLLQAHYVNAGATDLDAKIDIRMKLSDGSDIRQKAGTMFLYDPFIFVPAGGKARAGMRCAVQKDVEVLRLFTHTHARGTGFRVWLDPASGEHTATPIHTSTDWEHPTVSPPPFPVSAGSRFRFECEYDNSKGAADFYQGQSAVTNEMCALAVTYYPELGIDQDYCISGGDEVGFGTGTCGALLDCELACKEQHSSDIVGVPACVQKCVVASCPKAGTQIRATRDCVKSKCKDECATGGDVCAACVNASCSAEAAACRAATCD